MVQEWYGWTGKILRVDLSSNSITTEATEKYLDKYLGGKAISQAILFEEVPEDSSPFDPENRVIIGAGTLVGTLAPSACRVLVACKNAFTNGIASASAGGHFAPEVKFAGYDQIVIHGKAERPVYLWIKDDHVELRGASEIWGRTVWEAEDWIKEDVGEKHLHSALIGQAGENLVRGGCVIVDRGRAAARGGHGAVMGSKNFKGIAVRGTGAVKVADPECFMRAVENSWKVLADSTVMQGLEHGGGTHLFGSFPCNQASIISVRNAQDAQWARERLERVDYPVFEQNFEKRRVANFACPSYNSHIYEIKEGPYAPLIEEGFQANTVWAAARLDVDHAPWLIQFHALLHQYGLDNDFAANVIGWAMELYERGLLTKKDTDGLELTWGNHEAATELLRKIVFREGIGDLLAEGVATAAREIGKGSEKYAIHIKGHDIVDEFRAAIGWGLGIATALRGGGHLDGAPLPETDGTPDYLAKRVFDIPTFDPLSYEGKAKLVFWHEKFKQVVDAVGICYMATCWLAVNQRIGLPELAELVSAATGRRYLPDELMEVGRRAHNLQKAFNTLHAGFKRDADLPPKRFLEEPIKTGPFAGVKLDLDKWNRMLDEYYELHGWDKATGWQTQRCLEELDLGEAAKRLQRVGRLVASPP